MLDDGSQRRPVQMVKVRVRDQNQIDSRKIANSYSWFAQPLQHKQPARKIGIDDDVLSANLQEKAGVPNESHAQFAIGDQLRFMSLAGPRGNGGVPHQGAKCRARLRSAGFVSVGFNICSMGEALSDPEH